MILDKDKKALKVGIRTTLAAAACVLGTTTPAEENLPAPPIPESLLPDLLANAMERTLAAVAFNGKIYNLFYADKDLQSYRTIDGDDLLGCLSAHEETMKIFIQATGLDQLQNYMENPAQTSIDRRHIRALSFSLEQLEPCLDIAVAAYNDPDFMDQTIRSHTGTVIYGEGLGTQPTRFLRARSNFLDIRDAYNRASIDLGLHRTTLETFAIPERWYVPAHP